MSGSRDTVIHLAGRIARNPEERDLLCVALRVKIAEMRKRGEAVPAEILELEQVLKDECDTGDPPDTSPR